jgi:ankyrin repeat protein
MDEEISSNLNIEELALQYEEWYYWEYVSERYELEQDYLNHFYVITKHGMPENTILSFIEEMTNEEVNINCLIFVWKDGEYAKGELPLCITALHPAEEIGTSIAKLLIEELGANVNFQDEEGNTPLHIACNECNIDLAKLFLSNGSNWNIKNNNGYRPLDMVGKKFSDIVSKKDLIDNMRIYVTKKIKRTIRGNLKKFGCAIKYGCDPDRVERFISFIIEYEININTLIYLHGRDLSNTSILACTVNCCDPENSVMYAKWIIKANADVNLQDGKGDTTLHLACLNYQADLIELFIKKGANWNIKDRKGFTPKELIGKKSPRYRIVYGYCDFYQQKKDKVDFSTNVFERTKNEMENYYLHLLYSEIKYGNLEGLKRRMYQIKTFFIDVNKLFYNEFKEGPGTLALCIPARSRNRAEAVQYAKLLVSELGAKLNMQDGYGNTPLHVACLEGHLQLINYYLINHADWNIRNNEGYLPIEMVGRQENRNEDITVTTRFVENVISKMVLRRLNAYTWFKLRTDLLHA